MFSLTWLWRSIADYGLTLKGDYAGERKTIGFKKAILQADLWKEVAKA
jgi:hypothetical protein